MPSGRHHQLLKQIRQLDFPFGVGIVVVDIVDVEIALAGQRVALLNKHSECRVWHCVPLQARGLTNNAFLCAWTESGERKRFGQPEFPQQLNENRVDKNCVNRMCHRDLRTAIACRNSSSWDGGRTTI